MEEKKGKRSKIRIILAIIWILLVMYFIKINNKISNHLDSKYVYGYIDKTGQEVIEPQFYHSGDFHEGLAYACTKLVNKCGYIDKTGSFVVSPQFDNANDFSEGLASVEKGNLWGYINKNGDFVIKPKFAVAGNFKNGIAHVCSWFFQNSYIDKNGKTLFNLHFISTFGEFSDGMKVVWKGSFLFKNTKYGFINKVGEIVIKPQFDDANEFNDGLASVKKDDKWGYIDKTGKLAIPMKFQAAWDFKNGYAFVKASNKCGFIDKKGNLVINIKYDCNNLRAIRDNMITVSINNKLGCIDKTGKIIIKPNFDEINKFNEGIAAVKIGNKWGYIDKTGKIIVKPKFDHTSKFSENLAKIGVIEWKD